VWRVCCALYKCIRLHSAQYTNTMLLTDDKSCEIPKGNPNLMYRRMWGYNIKINVK